MLDEVRLLVGGLEIIPKEYEIVREVFRQPCSFAVTIGDRLLAEEILATVRPGMAFQMYVNDTLQFTGRIDGPASPGTAQGTNVTIRGRDMMCVLLGAHAESEETFTDITYAELVEKMLKRALGDTPFALVYTNDANRKAVTAARAPTANRSAKQRADLIGLNSSGAPVVTGSVEVDGFSLNASGIPTVTPAPPAAPPTPPATPPSRTIKVEIGEALYEGVLKPELDRAGLLLMATADGNFWLGAPDTSQRSSASLTRREDARNIKDHEFAFETTNRHSSYTVSFRSGGGATTRKSGGGRIEDEEMVSFGIRRPWARKDDKIKTAAQADQYVKRQMSDERRASFHLVYEVEGHSTLGPSGEDVIWGPETTVDVDDDELNLHRKMYVAGVRMVSAPTLTFLTLCRLGDILHATPEDGFVQE